MVGRSILQIWCANERTKTDTCRVSEFRVGVVNAQILRFRAKAGFRASSGAISNSVSVGS